MGKEGTHPALRAPLQRGDSSGKQSWKALIPSSEGGAMASAKEGVGKKEIEGINNFFIKNWNFRPISIVLDSTTAKNCALKPGATGFDSGSKVCV